MRTSCERYRAAFGGEELPVPVESIAEDLLGLAVEARESLPYSGMLIPTERRILVSADVLMPSPAVRTGGKNRFGVSAEALSWRR